jgi:hypothetical protein
VLCQTGTLESRDHLFFECEFAVNCWFKLNIQWDMSVPLSGRYMAARSNFVGPCFMEIISCSAWNIWKLRNDVIFRGIPWHVGKLVSAVIFYYIDLELKQPLVSRLLTGC